MQAVVTLAALWLGSFLQTLEEAQAVFAELLLSFALVRKEGS